MNNELNTQSDNCLFYVSNNILSHELRTDEEHLYVAMRLLKKCKRCKAVAIRLIAERAELGFRSPLDVRETATVSFVTNTVPNKAATPMSKEMHPQFIYCFDSGC